MRSIVTFELEEKEKLQNFSIAEKWRFLIYCSSGPPQKLYYKMMMYVLLSAFLVVVPDFYMWASKCRVTVPLRILFEASDHAKETMTFRIDVKWTSDFQNCRNNSN